jgi:X-Pro dipeptidyl-peptidase
VRAAVLEVHGLNDYNVKTQQAAQWYGALRERNVPHKIWWHQQGHEDPIGLRKDEWLRTMNRWFTRYLHGVPNGVEGEPKATIQREDSTWVDEPDWPAAQAKDTVLHPTPGGSQRGGLQLSGVETRAVESLTDDAGKLATDLVSAPNSPNRLVYVTAPAAKIVRVSGTPRVDLALSFNRPAANVTTLLVDQAPDGSTSVITRGWADPQNRDGLHRTTPIEPGKPYQINVGMQPDDYVLPAGHRLGLAVLSSDNEFTLRPKPGAGLSLDLRGTRMNVPLVDAEGAWR